MSNSSIDVASSSSPIILKKARNLKMIDIFGNKSGISTTLPSMILMKRKSIKNNNNNSSRIDNNNNTTNNTIDTNNNTNNGINNVININIINNNSRITEKRDTILVDTPINIEPDDYYHRHRERKLEYQKHYNKENDEKIKEYNKDYYIKRRAEILEKAKTRVICECGCDVQLSNMNAHKKTKKHLKRVGTVDAE
jgi:hypothetical protein